MAGKILPKIIILFIFILVLPVFSFAQAEKYPKTPETLEEVRDLIFELIKPIPEGMKSAWQEALAIWREMAEFFIDLWESKVEPWFQNIWREILALFGRELEKKESMIEEEIQKEKEEIKKEIPKVGKSIWERIKDWINR